MGARIGGWVAFVLAAPACTRVVALPIDAGSARAILLAVESAGGAVEVRAYGAAPAAVPVSLGPHDHLNALFYDATLDELQITRDPRGLVTPASKETPGARPLPKADQVLEAELEGDRRRWIEVAAARPAIERFLLPPLDPAVCANGGGCLDAGRCREPCFGSPSEEPVPASPSMPVEARLPSLVPGGGCAQRRRAITDDGVARCALEDVATSTCGADLGPVCDDANDWAPDVRAPNGRILYVRAGAGGGSGTRNDPFGAIAGAIASARAGDVVAIAKGAYDEDLTFRTGVGLWGACPKETVLTRPQAIAGGVVELRALAIRSTTSSPSLLVSSSSVTLAGVSLERSSSSGLYVSGGSHVAAAELSACRNHASGVIVTEGSTVVLRDALVHFNGDQGVWADRGARVSIEDSIVRSSPDARSNAGVVAEHGSSVEIQRTSIEGSANFGVYLEGARAALTDVWIHDSGIRSARSGVGIKASAGRLDGARIAVDRTGRRAIELTEATTSSISDLAIRDSGGEGFSIGSSPSSVERMLVRGSHDVALEFGTPTDECSKSLGRTDIDLRDITVEDIQPSMGNEGGLGFYVVCDTHLRIARVKISNVHDQAFDVDREGSDGPVVDLEDITVEDVGRGAIDTDAIHLGAGRSQVRRALAARAASGAGLGVLKTATVSASDVELRDNVDGLQKLDPLASLVVRRFRISGNRGHGVLLVGGMLDLHEGVVEMNNVGAESLDSSYDLTRLLDRVVYRHNVVDVASK
jgi:parallel beta helix pectate lyase-like protein